MDTPENEGGGGRGSGELSVAKIEASSVVAASGGRLIAVRNPGPPAAGDSDSAAPDCQSWRRSRRLAGVQRQYVEAELFPSLTDMEDENDGVEFCWRDEDV